MAGFCLNLSKSITVRMTGTKSIKPTYFNSRQDKFLLCCMIYLNDTRPGKKIWKVTWVILNIKKGNMKGNFKHKGTWKKMYSAVLNKHGKVNIYLLKRVPSCIFLYPCLTGIKLHAASKNQSKICLSCKVCLKIPELAWTTTAPFLSPHEILAIKLLLALNKMHKALGFC